MNIASRIPKLNGQTFDSALIWFAEMQQKDLMLHPDDDPATMQKISDGLPLFTQAEINEVRFCLSSLFEQLGDDVYEAAYPIVMRAFGLQLDA